MTVKAHTEMRYRQLLDLIEKAGLSPERAAAELGIAGMTLRRWRAKPEGAELPEMYRRAFEPVVKRLVGEGRLHPEDPDVLAAVPAVEDPFQSSLLGAGITHEILKPGETDRGSVISGLERIGGDSHRQAQVHASGGMMARFRALGADWKKRVDDLLLALRSERLTGVDKLVAFGALFYLIAPFDLVPDTLPVLGLADDFIIAGIAVAHYRRRFPELFKSSRAR